MILMTAGLTVHPVSAMTTKSLAVNNAIPTDHYNTYVYRKLFPCFGRVNVFEPDAGDAWYLRLLIHRILASGWEDIRIVYGVLYGTHNEAVRQRGLVQDEQVHNLTFQDATASSISLELRTLSVTLILAGDPASALWDSHCNALTFDFFTTMSPSPTKDGALLSKHGKRKLLLPLDFSLFTTTTQSMTDYSTPVTEMTRKFKLMTSSPN